MIRIVLVGHSATEWKLVRQTQWMAEVRRDPRSALLSKRHFDIDEASYREALDRWGDSGAGLSLATALEILGQSGAIEIIGP